MKFLNLKNEERETRLGIPTPEALALPFYNLLPTDEIGLLKWRLYVRTRCLDDIEFRSVILQACEKDAAFFANTLVEIHETRLNPRNVPLMLWTDQADVLALVCKDFGLRDMVISKSRGIGMSWLFTVIFLHKFFFSPQCDLGVVSKDEVSLDLVNRPTTLMGKFDYVIQHLPWWMRYTEDGKPIIKRTSGDHKFENLLTMTGLIGYVPTSEKLRSGRFFSVLFDEFAFVEADDVALMAATQYVSFCRIFLSTFHGRANLFFRLAHNEKAPLLRIKTFWHNNPDRAKGLYKIRHGRPEIIDTSFKFPIDYFDTIPQGLSESLLRSPFFDYEASRAGVDLQSLLEELNGVAAIDTRKLVIDDYLVALRAHLKPPSYRGYFSDDGNTWEEDLDGPWRFWRNPKSLTKELFIGIDPSSGVASGAYAAMTGIDTATGETIFTYAGHLTPIDLARLAATMGKALTAPGRYAMISWETTGIGTTFTSEIIRLKYPRLHVNDSNRYGYQNNDRGEAALWELIRSIRDGDLIVYDTLLADELENFEYDRDGELVWAGTDGHADRAIATAVSWQAAKARRKSVLQRQASRNTITQEGFGPEFEPLMHEMTQNSQDWSSQFRGHR